MNTLAQRFITIISTLLTFSCSPNQHSIEQRHSIEFQKLYTSAKEQLGHIDLLYDTLKIHQLGDYSLYQIKTIGRGKPDWSISEKVLVADRNEGVLFESGFIQVGPKNNPGCAVGRVVIDEIGDFEKGSFIFIDSKEYFKACCGHHETIKVERSLFDAKTLELILKFENEFQDFQNGQCLKVGKKIRRETTLTVDNDFFILQTEHFLDETLIHQTKKEINKEKNKT